MDLQKQIPRGKFKRSTIIASTTARAGLKKAAYMSKRPFLSQTTRDREDRLNDERIAAMVFDALSTLRGTALKAAQMMSMEMELIPEVYRQELDKAASQVPPINRALIRKIIINELGGPPEKIFKFFNSVPFAAASLGQVHRAVSHSNDELAVKVQYPGIASSVKSDIDTLKAILRPTRYYRIFSAAFNEIRERISEELDYFIEAKNTEWFRENVSLKNVLIPKVYSRYSTQKVLTSSMIHGPHLDEWLKTGPTKSRRNHFGQVLVNLFYHSIYKSMVIHADPNIGNYIFMDDGRIGVIDFGCVKKMSQDFLRALSLTNEKDFENNPDKMKEFYRSAGIHFDEDFNNRRFKNFIHRWVGWILRPERAEWFDFSESNGYFEESTELLKEFYDYISYFEGRFIYFGRSYYGLRRLLQRLGAKVRMRPLS